jgi:hypothetical protein
MKHLLSASRSPFKRAAPAVRQSQTRDTRRIERCQRAGTMED